jgi:hypothetical protein
LSKKSESLELRPFECLLVAINCQDRGGELIDRFLAFEAALKRSILSHRSPPQPDFADLGGARAGKLA